MSKPKAPAIRYEPKTPIDIKGKMLLVGNKDLAEMIMKAGSDQGTLAYIKDTPTSEERTVAIAGYYIDMATLYNLLTEYMEPKEVEAEG